MKKVLFLVVIAALVGSGLTEVSSGWNHAGGGNPPTRTITICKQTKPAGGANFPFTFPFTWANGFGALPSFTLNDGQCVTKDVTNQDSYNRFTENVPPGWTLTGITCNNVKSPVKFLGADNDPGFQPGDNTMSIDLIETNVKCVFSNEALASQGCTKPPSAMESWWTGDGNASDLVGGFNGTAVGAVGYVPGMVAQAFDFTSKGYIEVPDNPVHLPKGSFTVDAWVKPHGFIAGGRMTVVSKYDYGGICLNTSYSTYQLALVSGNVRATIRDTDAGGIPNGQGQVLTGPFVADGKWHHLAMVREMATKQFLLYVDGALVTSATLNAGADSILKDDDLSPDSLYIGAMKIAGGQFQAGGVANMEFFFVGMIDEVEYFNRGLAAIEIAKIYKAGSSGKCKR